MPMSFAKLAKYFQARVRERVEVHPINDPSAAGAQGGVGRKPDGTLIAGLRPTLDAYGRTVRTHEADHVQFSAEMVPGKGKRRPQWQIDLEKQATAMHISGSAQRSLMNGIEDARISLVEVWNRRPISVRRDAAAVALKELREQKKAIAAYYNTSIPNHTRDEIKASIINCALRCTALLRMSRRKGRHSGGWEEFHAADQPGPEAMAAMTKLGAELSAFLPNLSAALSYAADGRPKAMELVVTYVLAMAAPLPNPPMPDLPPMMLAEADADYDDESDHSGYFMGCIPLRPTDRVQLIKPPLTADCTGNDQGEAPEAASCGYRVRRGCLAQIALGIPVARPFLRTLAPAPAGVVLIDGSGSMHADNEKLREVCRLAPGFSVFYYSEDYGVTNIVCYAHGGKRMADSTTLPNHGNGNGQDSVALRHALAQREALQSVDPVLFITDCGFGQETCHSLLADCQRSGTVRVIRSIPEAIAEFSGVQTVEA